MKLEWVSFVLVFLLVCPGRGEEIKKIKMASTKAGLGDKIELSVEGWTENDKLQPQSWVLYLDGMALKGLTPHNQDFHEGTFTFYLRRSKENMQVWTDLLQGWSFEREVSIAIGPLPESGGPEKSIRAAKFTLLVFSDDKRLYSSYAIIAGVVLALVLLGWKTNLLRESGTGLDNPPFSLGKVQLAWWIVLILAAYLAIGLVTWDYSTTFSVSALGLLGISTGTLVIATFVDTNKQSQNQQEIKTQRQEILQLKARLDEGASKLSALEKQWIEDDLKTKEVRIARLTRVDPSKNFFLDIFTDGDGMSLHRFQIVVWTVTLGMVFFFSVWNEKSMPEFNANLLMLMGISSTTYLALKNPDNKPK